MTDLSSDIAIQTKEMFSNMDVLLVQDGGCAPGYNPVTSFLTHDFEKAGRNVFAAAEGFKSLVAGGDEDFFRLIYDQDDYSKWESIPHVFNAVFLARASGAQFRSERFKEFVEEKYQDQAVKNILARNVKTLVAIGGNGTFLGACALAAKLPPEISMAFVPVTIDSDVSGSETLGQHTGVEVGAIKIAGYLSDARTHHRVYVIEMMGARGGYHALYSCLGARAHLAVLPGMTVDYVAVMKEIAERDDATIVVAEGWAKDQPERASGEMNSAEYFIKQLLDTGIDPGKRLIAESFSRDIRGMLPNNKDMVLAQRMSAGTVCGIQEGQNRFMYAVNGDLEGFLSFSEIETDNVVSSKLACLADRLTR